MAEISARHRLEPYAQGLDGLCGLYAAINALRLATADHAPLTSRQCKALFAEGINFLHRKKGLDAAVVSGMGIRRRHALTRHLAALVRATNCKVVVERPVFSGWSSIDQAVSWITQSLQEGSAVIAALMGALDHCTVIAGATESSLLLFDSSGQRFIRKSSCGLRAGHYQIPPNELLRITVRQRS